MGLKKPPSQIQLPHGTVLQGVPFKITSYDDDGCPKTFEILPKGTTVASCWLYADENWIRGSVPFQYRK